MASGITGSLVRGAFGGKIDATSVLVDAFGNALGNSIVDRMAPSRMGQSPSELSDEIAGEENPASSSGGGAEAANARMNNNPSDTIRSGSEVPPDDMQLASSMR